MICSLLFLFPILFSFSLLCSIHAGPASFEMLKFGVPRSIGIHIFLGFFFLPVYIILKWKASLLFKDFPFVMTFPDHPITLQ
jgi:hypothetical protein